MYLYKRVEFLSVLSSTVQAYTKTTRQNDSTYCGSMLSALRCGYGKSSKSGLLNVQLISGGVLYEV